MTRTIQHVDILRDCQFRCAKCGLVMYEIRTTYDAIRTGNSIRMKCPNRSCEQFGLVGEMPIDHMRMLVVTDESEGETITVDAPVVDEIPPPPRKLT